MRVIAICKAAKTGHQNTLNGTPKHKNGTPKHVKRDTKTRKRDTKTRGVRLTLLGHRTVRIDLVKLARDVDVRSGRTLQLPRS